MEHPPPASDSVVGKNVHLVHQGTRGPAGVTATPLPAGSIIDKVLLKAERGKTLKLCNINSAVVQSPHQLIREARKQFWIWYRIYSYWKYSSFYSQLPRLRMTSRKERIRFYGVMVWVTVKKKKGVDDESDEENGFQPSKKRKRADDKEDRVSAALEQLKREA